MRSPSELPAEGADSSLHNATIIGAGRMGLGIAESFVIAGLEVTFVEATPELCRESRDRLTERMRGHAEAGLIPHDATERAPDVVVADSVVEAVKDADLIVEAVTEDIEIKRIVLEACDAGSRPDAIIASNTSSLDINQLARFVVRAERFLGMHWFNPPEWTPGVEVVPGDQTDPEVAMRIVSLLREIGKRPCLVSATVGFVANRLQMALFCEAVRCVEEGVASPAELDEVVRSCFGFRLPYFGPFQIADMAGLDVYEAVLEQHEQAFGPRFEVPEAVRRLVRDGRRGTAARAGFYDYDADAADALLVERDRRYAALSELLRDKPPLEFDGGGRAET